MELNSENFKVQVRQGPDGFRAKSVDSEACSGWRWRSLLKWPSPYSRPTACSGDFPYGEDECREAAGV